MEKALQRVSELLGEDAAQTLRAWFERIGEMPGANRLFQRIAPASDKDQLGDYLAEARYALVFAGLGFQMGESGWAAVVLLSSTLFGSGIPTALATRD